jgi:two-component system LytT family response regulator
MIKAIAIDDEPLALEVIRSHAAKVPFLQLDQCFTDAFKAIEYLAANTADLIFLDIKMPDISGLEFLESLQYKPMVIFTTAYAEHAVRSYELNAVDYLLKPFAFTRFLNACHKANDIIKNNNGAKPKPSQSIFIKTGYEQLKINFGDILYLQSGGNYMSFVLADGRTVLSRLTVNEALLALPAEQFVRVHRSYIINKNKIDRVERHQVHIGIHKIPVGESFNKETIFNLIK